MLESVLFFLHLHESYGKNILGLGVSLDHQLLIRIHLESNSLHFQNKFSMQDHCALSRTFAIKHWWKELIS